MTITVVGLGPGDPVLLTVQAREFLTGLVPIWFRTRHHPAVAAFARPPVQSFDDHIAQTAAPDAVRDAIITQLTELAAAGDLIYAVPGDPLVGDAVVPALLARARQGTGPAVRVVHGVSFLEPVCAALALDPLADGLQLVDALDARLDPTRPGVIIQVTHHGAAALRLTLLDRYPSEHPVTLVQRAGMPDERIETWPINSLDRLVGELKEPACLYLPALEPEADLRSFDGLRAISHRLRSPEGCPWDREQTHASLKPFLLEETYEVLAALDDGDPARLCEELGDLLLQMTLHTEIAEEAREFTYGDVFEAINRKLIRRHPHVFGDAQIETSDEQWVAWQQIKREEKGEAESILAGVPKTMPALAYAQAVQERAARTGFDWPDLDQVLEKLIEELAELRAAPSHEERIDEFGDVLFVLANVARWLKLDAEEALRRTNAKFARRFGGIERLAREHGRSLEAMSLDEMEALYQQVKAEE